MAKPQVGQKVVIKHKTGRDGRVVGGRPVIQGIDAVYMDGRIKTTSGDTWNIKANGSHWESVK